MRVGLCTALLAVLASLQLAHAVGPGLLYTQSDAATASPDASLLQVKSQASALDASTAEGERHKYLLQRVASSFALVGSVAVPFVASTPEEIKQQEAMYEREWQELDQLQKSDNVVALELGTEVLSTAERKTPKVLERLKLMTYPEPESKTVQENAAASTFVPQQKLFISTASAPTATVTLTEVASTSSRAGARHRQSAASTATTHNVRDLLDAASGANSDDESNSDDSNTDEDAEQNQDEENNSDSDNNDSEESDVDTENDSDNDADDVGGRMRFAQRRGFFDTIKKVGKGIVNFFKPKPKPKPAEEPKKEEQKKEEEKYQGPSAQEVEDCSGCRYVWSQVEMDVGAARYVEDVQASFEHNCMEAQKSAIFYGVCEDMYDDMYAMTDDYMSNKFSITDMCKRAKMCGKRYKDPVDGKSNKATNNLKKPKTRKDKKKKKRRW